MVSATFIFRQNNSDESFEALDLEIERLVSKETDFLGKDVWTNEEKQWNAVVYYFSSQKGLDALRNYEAHRQAKSNYQKWYAGYQVIISEVVSSYGDGWITHPTKQVGRTERSK